jgi:hypothetical protein
LSILAFNRGWMRMRAGIMGARTRKEKKAETHSFVPERDTRTVGAVDD